MTRRPTLTVTLPDGTVAQKSTAVRYTHVLIVRDPRGEKQTKILRWSRTLRSAAVGLYEFEEEYRNGGFIVEILPVNETNAVQMAA